MHRPLSKIPFPTFHRTVTQQVEVHVVLGLPAGPVLCRIIAAIDFLPPAFIDFQFILFIRTRDYKTETIVQLIAIGGKGIGNEGLASAIPETKPEGTLHFPTTRLLPKQVEGAAVAELNAFKIAQPPGLGDLRFKEKGSAFTEQGI